MTLTADALVAGSEFAPTPLLRPPALQKGATIGVVAPSYSPREGWLTRGVKALERAGFQVLLDSELMTFRRFTRKEDERRAENFIAMWVNPEVKAIIGGTGGYGAVRMLPYLEPEVFRLHPKIFVGYSDVTALHLWLNRRAGLRTFHGPTVDDLVPGTRDPTLGSLRSEEHTSELSHSQISYAVFCLKKKKKRKTLLLSYIITIAKLNINNNYNLSIYH